MPTNYGCYYNYGKREIGDQDKIRVNKEVNIITVMSQNKAHFLENLQTGCPKIRHIFRKISKQKVCLILGHHCIIYFQIF